MSIKPFRYDEDPEEIHESDESLASSLSALTENHYHSTYESPFTLKVTTNDLYVSHSDDEGLSSDEVGRLIGSDLTPWGVDFMELSFPVKTVESQPPFPWAELHGNIGKWTHMWMTSFEIGQGTVDLKVTAKGNSLLGYLKFNPTTCLYGPKSRFVARLDDAVVITDMVLDAVDHWVQSGCGRHEMLLSRIDVNVTVEPVADVQRVLSIAKSAATRGMTPLATYGKAGRLESVVRRSKRAGGFCIYDKGLQAGLSTPTIRFEVTTRRGRLRDMCSTLGELSEDKLRTLALKSLQPVVDVLVMSPRNAIDDVLADKKYANAFLEMIGLAVLADLGHHPGVSSYAMRKKYRPILKQYSARTVGDLLN